MGFGDLDSNNPEGSHLDKIFMDDNLRIKNNSAYWMRSPHTSDTRYVFNIHPYGRNNFDYPSYTGRCGSSYSSLLKIKLKRIENRISIL
jgi:hypothetical protein